MKTTHEILFSDSRAMKALPDESVNLILTSPPYPMIEMWDELFSLQDAGVKKKLKQGDGAGAFELMHRLLDSTWKEAYRVIKTGGFACINIGDAVRTIDGNFVLYTNHARILKSAQELGFSSLPCVLWRKQTNAPNKFMGSGMLPAGAYVTLEHEYILILRKGPKREFIIEPEKENRRESALFWEERNTWFSDVWFDVKGTPQALNDKDARNRSAAFPFELAYRLINMYSVKNDLVVDPFLGIGTTTAAAIASGRNSVGYELDPTLGDALFRLKDGIVDTSRRLVRQRLIRHVEFVVQRLKAKGVLKHENIHYGFPVMTSQEKELLFNDPQNIKATSQNAYEVEYSTVPQKEFCRNWASELEQDNIDDAVDKLRHAVVARNSKQATIF
ncbi:MAG: site-specific DNA-methyltransferase [Deltaproteobacteria bacterium]|nr:site-specific DNA-methyltransferase [Deltaproteobacteria bacterium]